ncbi:MAG: TetR/AcrR family transcriptional regulator, partial [Lachnospiraceae bacterium]|nr:TetR/AcrR family transcriptional regulator [Lachnospiraceae bacterium]
KSAGTKYVDFVHDFVMQNQKMFLDAVKYLKKKGYPVIEVDEEEVHILLSAYVTACFETILHHYDEPKINRYLDTIQQFFMPGWLRIMGVS